ncbi:MAG: epoxyqueuosine reductase QueH [Candidatus Gastranaerophilales bacterium]|nr:epoxyqueuosine reductase QueH [Candidatus Gastranaerophilales bacterium]
MSSNKVLLHACCAPCLTNSIEELIIEGFDPVVYFYNPNIYPEQEYLTRKEELILFCKKKGYELVIEEGDEGLWHSLCEPLAKEPEGAKRCAVCFEMRLDRAAKYAKERGFDYFCTTLTISPHKNSKVINEIGKSLCQKYGVDFLERNFKKNDGFKKSLEISKNYNLFRQAYCGCQYSIRSI